MRGERLSRKAYAPKKFGPMPPTVHPAKSPPTAPARNGHAAFHSAKANAFQSMSSFISCFPSLFWINSDGWQNGLRYHSGSLRAFQPATCRISVFCIWRKRPPDLLCRRQLKTHSGKIAGCSGCRARSLGVTVVEPIFQPSEYISCFLVGGASWYTSAPSRPKSQSRLFTRLRAAALPQTASFTPVVKDRTPKGLGRVPDSVTL